MNRLQPEKQKQVIAALVEGNSIRATCRMTGVAKGTVSKLLANIGTACAELSERTSYIMPLLCTSCIITSAGYIRH